MELLYHITFEESTKTIHTDSMWIIFGWNDVLYWYLRIKNLYLTVVVFFVCLSWLINTTLYILSFTLSLSLYYASTERVGGIGRCNYPPNAWLRFFGGLDVRVNLM